MPLLTLHDPARARRYHERGLWRDESLYALMAAHAAARPDAFALHDGARRLTWRALRDWTDAVADALRADGLAPGDRVAMAMSNRIEAVVVMLACSRNGYVGNPSLHRNYPVAEIVDLVGRISAAALFAERGWGADGDRVDLPTAAAALPSMRKVYPLPADRTPGEAMPMPPPPQAAPDPDPSADKVCYMAFTSGTTGMPKGVMHSDNTLLANARDLVADWGHGPDSVMLTLSPLSHHIAWVALAQALVAGAELVVNDPPPGTAPLDWIIETGATYVMGVPTHAIDILAAQRARGLDRLGAVKLFYMAGAPIPRATAEAFLDQGIMPQNVYGMTENSSHQYTHPDDPTDVITGTCGRGGAAYEVRIFDPENRDIELPRGEVGEIGGCGAALMLGYFGDQAETERSFNRDGWFMSGDLGRLDQNGCLEIVGRLKDVIIRGGRNIYPRRIEDLAVRHPAVDKAAAIPVPHARLGEKVCLAVTGAEGVAPEAAAILDHLHGLGLPKTDMPEYFAVLTAFPLTASGKIMKRVLIDWLGEGRFTPRPVRFDGGGTDRR